jgi:hypothetical protein
MPHLAVQAKSLFVNAHSNSVIRPASAENIAAAIKLNAKNSEDYRLLDELQNLIEKQSATDPILLQFEVNQRKSETDSRDGSCTKRPITSTVTDIILSYFELALSKLQHARTAALMLATLSRYGCLL